MDSTAATWGAIGKMIGQTAISSNWTVMPIGGIFVILVLRLVLDTVVKPVMSRRHTSGNGNGNGNGSVMGAIARGDDTIRADLRAGQHELKAAIDNGHLRLEDQLRILAVVQAKQSEREEGYLKRIAVGIDRQAELTTEVRNLLQRDRN